MTTLSRCGTALKAFRLVWTLLTAGLAYLFVIKLTGRAGSIAARAAWLQRTSQRLLQVLGIDARYVGNPPSEGVLVSNHISYLDIMVHSARHPLVFISKAEVAQWPGIGLLTQFAGTLFIRRDLRSDVLRVAAEMPLVLEAGVVLAFFPEGTSTGGNSLLPFRTPLLAPLVKHGWQVTPAFLHYALEPGEGSVEDDVAYYRPETVFGTHLLKLLGKRRIFASVTYGNPQEPGSDRKELASRLHAQICALGGLPEAVEMTVSEKV